MNQDLKIVGVTHENDRGPNRQGLLSLLYDDWWTEGREDEVGLELRREPDNPYDPGAVAVWVTHPESGKLGYISSKEANKWVADVVDEGDVTGVSLKWMGYGKVSIRGERRETKLIVSAKVTVSFLDPDDEETDIIKDDEGRSYKIGVR